MPYGVAVTPDGKYAYVANFGSGNVSVIDTATNTLDPKNSTINVGNEPWGVAITPYGSPNGANAYVTNYGSNTASVINTSTNSIKATIYGLNSPYGVAVTPDRSTVYVTNHGSSYFPGNTVSVINTSTNSIIAMVPVGNSPMGVAVTLDGTKAYVVNDYDNNVSVINKQPTLL